MEEAGSDSSKKMQDKEETTSEASWTAVTKGKEIVVWRPEPEGQAEKPEATVLWSGVEGVSVNPEGESRHRHARSEMARKGREPQTRMEEKVNEKAPWDEGPESEKKSYSGGI